MLPPQSLTGNLPNNDGLSALDEILEKIPPAEGLEDQMVTRAGYSTIDLMGHVNNARYIDWISDCFTFEEHLTKKLSWLQINYVNEVKPGEPVALQRGAYPGGLNTWYITGTNLVTGAKAFEAQVGWENGNGSS
jgi:hypothetical protein